MTTTVPPPAPRRWLARGAAWLGVALLAVSLAAADPGDGDSRAPSPGAVLPAAKKVVGFGHVDVESGLVPLYPIQPGRVAEVKVREDEPVKAGAPLFVMDRTAAESQVDEAKADLAAAEARARAAEDLPRQQAARVDAQKEAVAAKRAELAAAQAKRDQASRLAERKVGSAEDARVAAETVKALEAGVRAEEAKLRALESLDARAGLDQARHEVEAKKAQLRRAEYALEQCTVRAPVDGKVLRLFVSAGEALGPNPRQPALYFCPDTPRIVRAEIEQEFADGVAVGQKAVIVDDSSNAHTWTGEVTRVGDWFSHRRSILQEPVPTMPYNDVRTLEAIIKIDPGQKPLRIGQRVRVTLVNGG